MAALARGGMAATGAGAGLALWALGEPLAPVLPARLHLALLTLVAAGFAAQLLLSGPLGSRAALPRALGLGLLIAALASSAALRFDDPGQVMQRPHLALAGVLVLYLALPFVIAQSRAGLLHYPTLFEQAWSILLRGLGAALFLALGWGLLVLASAVLGLVGIDLLDRVLEQPSVAMALSGLMLGLALAVLDEFHARLPLDPALRLVRLLAPLVLGLVVVFLAALGLRGAQVMPGGSVAGTVLSLGLVALVLIVLTVERTPDRAAVGTLMRGAARGLCLVLPVLAGIAIWAVALRVAALGWSPPRLAAAAVSGVLLAHGLAYAALVLWPGDWPGRLRRANPPLALAALALSLAWLTPLVNAERISAASHLARFQDGRLSVGALDLAALRQDWGRAGAAALDRLRALAEAPGGAALAARLAALEAPPDTGADLRAALAALLPVLGNGAEARAAVLADLPEFLLADLRDACLRRTAAGNPGCALIAQPGAEPPAPLAWLVQTTRGGVMVMALHRDPAGGLRWQPAVKIPLRGDADAERILDRLQQGAYRIAPSSLPALHVEGLEFLALP